MSQITWDTYDGYIHSDQVSKILRESLRPKAKFRQFATPLNGSNTSTPLHRGDTFYWNVFQTPPRQDFKIAETDRIQSSTIGQIQNSLSVTEMARAIEHTQKAQLLSFQDWEAIISSGLSFMAASQFDAETFVQMKRTPLKAVPASGSSTDAIALSTNGTPSQTNGVALGTGHVKAIVDQMKARNIPPNMDRDSYVCVTDVANLRGIRNSLETIHQYTDTGLSFIKFGEIGRYEDTIFVEQTMIPAGGAADSTTFNAFTNTGDAWNSAKSSWAMFFGDDPVTEAIVVPEEIRAKLPEDYGRDRGSAFYYLGGFGITHPDADNSRVIMWDSAA